MRAWPPNKPGKYIFSGWRKKSDWGAVGRGRGFEPSRNERKIIAGFGAAAGHNRKPQDFFRSLLSENLGQFVRRVREHVGRVRL